MTQATDHYDRLLAEHYTWMLGDDVPALAASQEQLLTSLGVAPLAAVTTAVDLGCGPGQQSLALAALGFTPVIAVDTSRTLLDELDAYAGSRSAITTVEADIRTVLPEATRPGGAAAVVCMGDTLTHLPARADATALLADVQRSLAPGGRLVVTYRDLTQSLSGTHRFIPVRSSSDRILTCFLEYADDDTVTVHDIVHTRSGDTWTQRVSSYPKLRIPTDWLAAECGWAGLAVEHSATGERGMHVLVAAKAR